jgi:hypothetical protein
VDVSCTAGKLGKVELVEVANGSRKSSTSIGTFSVESNIEGSVGVDFKLIPEPKSTW